MQVGLCVDIDAVTLGMNTRGPHSGSPGQTTFSGLYPDGVSGNLIMNSLFTTETKPRMKWRREREREKGWHRQIKKLWGLRTMCWIIKTRRWWIFPMVVMVVVRIVLERLLYESQHVLLNHRCQGRSRIKCFEEIRSGRWRPLPEEHATLCCPSH